MKINHRLGQRVRLAVPNFARDLRISCGKFTAKIRIFSGLNALTLRIDCFPFYPSSKAEIYITSDTAVQINLFTRDTRGRNKLDAMNINV